MFPQAAAMMGRSRRPLRPSDLSFVKAWWTPGLGVIKDGGNVVAGWNDQISNIPLGATGAVSWAANGFNGGPCVVFAGAGELRGNLPSSVPADRNEGWIFMLVKQGPAPGVGVEQTAWAIGDSLKIMSRRFSTGVQQARHSGGLGDDRSAADLYNVAAGALDLEAVNYSVEVSEDRRRTTGWKNEVEGGFLTHDLVSGSTLVIGAGWPGAYRMTGSVAEVVITTPLTAPQRQALAAAMLWAVGKQANLPGGHPYAAARPLTGG